MIGQEKKMIPYEFLKNALRSSYGKILIGCLLILSAQGLLENSADQVNQLRDIPSFYGVIGEIVRKSTCDRYRLQLFVYWEKHIRTA